MVLELMEEIFVSNSTMEEIFVSVSSGRDFVVSELMEEIFVSTQRWKRSSRSRS